MTDADKEKLTEEELMAAMEAELGIDSSDDNLLAEEVEMAEATKSINLIKQKSDMMQNYANKKENRLKYGESIDPFMDQEGAARTLEQLTNEANRMIEELDPKDPQYDKKIMKINSGLKKKRFEEMAKVNAKSEHIPQKVKDRMIERRKSIVQ
jgi:hypothetical protein